MTEANAKDLADYFRWKIAQYGIPEYMYESAVAYIVYGVPPGDFLEAVICNDLKGAVGHADSSNANALVGWVHFFYNAAPIDSWGSKKNMQAWIEKKREERQLQEHK